MNLKPINLKEKFDSFSEFWTPKVVGELNGHQVKLAKFKGEFVSHQHEDEDELFLVIEGQIKMELEDKTHVVHAGEFIIVPRGTQHKPSAIGEAKVLLFEPKSTVNTGTVDSELTIKTPDQI